MPDSLWHQGLSSVHCHAGLFSGEPQDIILGILLIFVLPGVVLVACLAVVARLVIREGQAVYACKQCKDPGPKVSSTGSCAGSGGTTPGQVCTHALGRLFGQALRARQPPHASNAGASRVICSGASSLWGQLAMQGFISG